MSTLKEQASIAKNTATKLNNLNKDDRNMALKSMAEALDSHRDELIKANQEDIKKAKEDKLPEPIIQRLKFDNKKIDSVISGINDLIGLEDLLEKREWVRELAPGLILEKVITPLGVLGIIFESRPDAFVQISSLALKSGNAVLLKGGREAEKTNAKLFEIINEATTEAGLPKGWIHNLTTREEVNAMLDLDEYIDLIIPRGSNEFVSYILNNTKIPVMGHADGICHTYVNKGATCFQA